MRSLDADEAALWAKVAATIRPLSRDSNDSHPPVDIPPPPPKAAAAKIPPRPVSAPRPNPPAQGVGQSLDGGWDRRLSRGAVRPDRILDLHGHSLDSAWSAIDRGLEQAVAAGERVVLLITGHRRKGDPPLARGKIRAAVEDWLAVSRHAGRIAAIRGAHRSHGGGGSLYIILRRR